MIARLRDNVTVLVIAAVFCALLLLRSPATPIIVPDSASYQSWSPTATLTYPIFIHIFSGWSLISVQVVLFSASAVALGYTVKQIPGGKWIAPLAVFAIFANPETDKLLWTMSSEGLFLSFDVCFLALVTAFAVNGRSHLAISAAFAAGLCATIRPAEIPLGLIPALACLLRWEGRTMRNRLCLAFVSMLLWASVIIVERITSHFVHKGAETSLMGPHMFAKAALINITNPTSPVQSPQAKMIAASMEQDYAPVRKILANQRDTIAYPALLAFYEVCIQHGCSQPLRTQLNMPEANANTLMATVAFHRIKHNLLGYLRLASDEYKSLWVIGVRSHPALGPAYDRELSRLKPLPFSDVVAPEIAMPSRPQRSMLFIRPAFMIMGIGIALLCLFLGGLALCGIAPSQAILPSLLAALSTQAIMLFTALVGIGDGRYTMGMWPNIACSLVLSLSAVTRWRVILRTAGAA